MTQDQKVLYKISIRSDSDSIWVREDVFIGNYNELVARYGPHKNVPFKSFVKNEKIYYYIFMRYTGGFWHYCADPRP